MDRITQLKSFLAESPGDSFVQHALALEYVKLGDDTEARKWFEGLLAKDENYIGSYYHLCQLLQRNGEDEAALKWYEKGLIKTKEAGDRHAYNELFSAYEDFTG